MENNVKYFRKKMGWTQEQLADRLAMSLSYVKKVEIGLICPSLKVLKKMSDLFECKTIDELVRNEAS